jgi:hypothetical protein
MTWFQIFSWYSIPKREKIYQMATKYTKWVKNLARVYGRRLKTHI